MTARATFIHVPGRLVPRLAAVAALLWLAGCQTAPQRPLSTQLPPTPVGQSPHDASPAPAVPAPALPPGDYSGRTPFPEELPPATTTPTPAPKRILRLPAVLQPKAPAASRATLPAVQNLINQAKAQLQAGQLDQAEQTLRQVQRMAPQHPALYAYLAELFLRRQQPDLADAAARRGLLYAQSPAQQKAFWQLVLMAAQQLKDAEKINEAQRMINTFP